MACQRMAYLHHNTIEKTWRVETELRESWDCFKWCLQPVQLHDHNGELVVKWQTAGASQRLGTRPRDSGDRPVLAATRLVKEPTTAQTSASVGTNWRKARPFSQYPPGRLEFGQLPSVSPSNWVPKTSRRLCVPGPPTGGLVVEKPDG